MRDPIQPRHSGAAGAGSSPSEAVKPARANRTTPGEGGGVRRVRMRTSGATLERLAGDAMLIRPGEALRPYPKVLTDRPFHWAKVCPDKVCVARRGPNDEWRWLTYAQVWDSVRSVGQALLDRGLSAERPVAILSENDLEQLVLTLAGQHVGIPVAPLSPSYSLVSKDFGKLRHALKILTPGMVFVSDGARYAPAIEAVAGEHVEVVATTAPPDRRNTNLFADLLATNPTSGVESAHDQIDPDGVAKFLFTSGSTDMPKAVINTHRMICSNQQMIAQTFGFLEDEPPVIVDWLPWNHVFGGNNDVGASLYNGGTFYIDDGKPGPGSIEKTVRNLREISTTIYFNVPKGYEDLLPFLRADSQLRETFFRRLKLMFYAGAGLSQPVWDAYRDLAFETCGERIIMATGLGSTETAPMAVQTTWETDRAGIIGIPVPGVELKLVPCGTKLEARVRGPNITPGYWRQPELTQKVFDEEGFYCFGDAVRFVDPHDVNKGLLFDGRLSEDFKLASGTWVSVGPLRARMIAHFAPFIRDVVVAGLNRGYAAAIIFADLEACRALAPELPRGAQPAEIVRHPAVSARFRSLLKSFLKESTGSSNKVMRAILAEELPSLDAGEITDKGSFNQRAVLQRRAELVDQLYAAEPSSLILTVSSK
ncbi:MAG TPA: feruloyl-CoA synthase [Candidatus Polarisedimenticolia bacterium]|nr:feruloyl-CoA synthase [Candidatus Polarisedimenticolia bacterium]